MHIVPGFLLRQVADETLAVPTGQAAQKLSGLMSCNSSGQFLLEQLQEDRTEAQLLTALLNTYDVDQETARADLHEFLQCLAENDLLIDESPAHLSPKE